MIAEDALCQVCELNDLPFTFNDILQKGESVIEKLENDIRYLENDILSLLLIKLKKAFEKEFAELVKIYAKNKRFNEKVKSRLKDGQTFLPWEIRIHLERMCDVRVSDCIERRILKKKFVTSYQEVFNQWLMLKQIGLKSNVKLIKINCSFMRCKTLTFRIKIRGIPCDLLVDIDFDVSLSAILPNSMYVYWPDKRYSFDEKPNDDNHLPLKYSYSQLSVRVDLFKEQIGTNATANVVIPNLAFLGLIENDGSKNAIFKEVRDLYQSHACVRALILNPYCIDKEAIEQYLNSLQINILRITQGNLLAKIMFDEPIINKISTMHYLHNCMLFYNEKSLNDMTRKDQFNIPKLRRSFFKIMIKQRIFYTKTPKTHVPYLKAVRDLIEVARDNDFAILELVDQSILAEVGRNAKFIDWYEYQCYENLHNYENELILLADATTTDEEQVPLTSYEPFFTECSSHDCCRTSLRIKHSVISSMNQLLVGFLVI